MTSMKISLRTLISTPKARGDTSKAKPTSGCGYERIGSVLDVAGHAG